MTLKKKLLALAAIPLAAVLGLSACSSGAVERSGSEASPRAGGSLTYVENSYGPPWSPHLVGPYEHSNLYVNIADTLVYNDPKKGEVPYLATSWDVSADKTEYTFHLRKGVTFSDGTPLDADAVKLNLDQLGLGDAALGITPLPYFSGYVSTTVEDAHTLTLKWAQPNYYTLKLLGIPAASIIAPSTLKLPATEQSKIQNVVGSGPFTVDSVKKNEQVVLKRRAGYDWAPSTSPNKGAAYLDTVTIKYVGDASLRDGALQSGQADIVRGVYPSDESGLRDQGDVIESIDASKSYYPYSITFRVNNPLVSDVRVREAITRAIDTKAFVKSVLSKSYTAAADVYGHTNAQFIDQSSKLSYDRKKAARLLDDAGWSLGSDGVREKDGTPLKIVIASNQNQAFAKDFGDYVVDQLGKVGIEVENRAGDNSYINYARSFDTGNQVALHIGQGWVPDGLRNFSLKSFTNLAADPKLTTWFQQERSSTTAADVRRYSSLQQKWLIDNYWVDPIVDEVQVYGSVPQLHGVRYSTDLGTSFQAAYLAK